VCFRQGILEQQVKDEVMKLQQKLKQKGIEMIQKIKADSNDKMSWFKAFKDKNQDGYDSIYKVEKEINELLCTNDVEGFPDRFTALEEKTKVCYSPLAVVSRTHKARFQPLLQMTQILWKAGTVIST
jgi:hypothetical protein